MSYYRNGLPQLEGGLFLTDGGLETTLIFHDGIELPGFASIVMFDTDEGIDTLDRYFRSYVEIAKQQGKGFILESASWRSNPDWATKLGYTEEKLNERNRQSIKTLKTIRDEYDSAEMPVVISGCVGPRGDGYSVDEKMGEQEAQTYHTAQVDIFNKAGADMVTAITMTYAEEAIGITRAAQASGIPVAISFTVETDGRLPSGQLLKEAIAQVDDATQNGPAYYMINCAHPTHFDSTLEEGAKWTKRIKGIRGNASKMSHAELDEAEELDDGNPEEMGSLYADLRKRFPDINVLGGCCGTDHRHIEAIGKACPS